MTTQNFIAGEEPAGLGLYYSVRFFAPLEEAKEVSLLLHIDGKLAASKTFKIDDESNQMGGTPPFIQLDLSPGIHEVRVEAKVEGKDLRTFTQTFEIPADSPQLWAMLDFDFYPKSHPKSNSDEVFRFSINKNRPMFE